ncbi:MAG TPA: phosphoglycerate mutase family protein [Gaiellaceae bacterium]|nr:phosphoglycerate mutase family protein [Gaiellaceae bacterium]
MTVAYLIRHARAKNRLKWSDPDHLRPLTKAGLEQASALPGLYDGQPFTRLFSSPYLRCVQTLEPLAVDRRLQLEVADELAEGAPIGAALELMLAVSSAGPAAFCTHADVMMDSIEELFAAGVSLDGPLEFKKAATWILEVRDRSYAGGRYLPPPGEVSTTVAVT